MMKGAAVMKNFRFPVLLLFSLMFFPAFTLRTNAQIAFAADSPGEEFGERRRAVAEMMETPPWLW